MADSLMQPVQRWLERLSVAAGPSPDGSNGETCVSHGIGTAPVKQHDAAVLAACDTADKAAAAELLADLLQPPVAAGETVNLAAAIPSDIPLSDASQPMVQLPHAAVDQATPQSQAAASPAEWLAQEIASRTAQQVSVMHHVTLNMATVNLCLQGEACACRCTASRNTQRCGRTACARAVTRS